MPKRSLEEKIQRYNDKVNKLIEKQRRKRRRLDNSSPEENGDNEIMDDATVEIGNDEIVEQIPNPNVEIENDPPFEECTQNKDKTSAEKDNDAFPTLEPDILLALGEATDQGPTFGEAIHLNLSQLWQPLLLKGIQKEQKEPIMRKYLIPNNCTALQAPKLNIEISAAVTEVVRMRDKKVENAQQQLGIGIAAISKAMTLLLTSDNKVEAIKTLSDGCRILCDLHFIETQTRIKMITPGLTKNFTNVIKDSERDETLFGSNLSEKIKASKAIEKQGLQIKKTIPASRKTYASIPQAPTNRTQFQENWTGPPRYPSNRGGARGGQRRFIPSVRQTSGPSMPMAQSKNQNRPRTQTRQ